MTAETKIYILPNLNFDYKDLQPFISEQQLQIHHQKHHQAYVNTANTLLENLDKTRKYNIDLDAKSVLKSLSFNIGGHILHSLFWENLTPPNQASKTPVGVLAAAINNEFGSFERFKKEFTQAAISVEGSGWAALAFCKKTNRPMIMQIEKHNVNLYPNFEILLVLDVWEHAYYIDYKNERAKFVEAFWNIVNWNVVNERLEELSKQ
jgi:Fe-Mn family superoxide dismutase